MDTKQPKTGPLADKEKFEGEGKEKLGHMGEKTRETQGAQQEKQTKRSGQDRE